MEPCPGSPEPALPWLAPVLTLASGPFLSSLRKDAGEEDGGSGEAKVLLGTILREVDAPVWSCPARDHTRPWLQQSFLAGKNGSQRLDLAGGRGQHIPGLHLSASKSSLQTEGLNLLPGSAGSLKCRGCVGIRNLYSSSRAEWGLTLKPSFLRVLLAPRPLPTPSACFLAIDPAEGLFLCWWTRHTN